MLARVEAEVDRKMDNGVRINPAFRERARRAEEEEGEARRAVEEQAAAVPRCDAGHSMVRRGEGAAGLTCDGCRRAIRRGWSGGAARCATTIGATRAARCRRSLM
jgi:hypothetical protein